MYVRLLLYGVMRYYVSDINLYFRIYIGNAKTKDKQVQCKKLS